MTYLLDTNVLSESRKRVRDPQVVEWLSTTPRREQHICVLTVGEIGRGITRLRQRGDHQQATIFEGWLGEVVKTFGSRIAPVTISVARTWAGQDPNHSPPTVDALIGATAQANGWTLVTRNTRDFEHLGIRLHNPFSP